MGQEQVKEAARGLARGYTYRSGFKMEFKNSCCCTRVDVDRTGGSLKPWGDELWGFRRQVLSYSPGNKQIDVIAFNSRMCRSTYDGKV